ncbi:MAG: PAS domain S-box protein [Methylobacterium sp.]|uniref:PAS domain S-box protein n=1 Tax=Methylobacterium sp. TaxID=409 RepID=UPI0025FEE57C|nr:PAS domain S-box protein [Methylobacterium sp.]MBX9933801.1 PAS domain S-box protein [Methylobacterium sp.]
MSTSAAGASGFVATRLTWFGLRARLLLLVIAALGPFAALQFKDLHQERRKAVAAAMERVEDAARQGAERYRDAIDDARSTLQLLSNVPDVTEGAAAACRTFLAGIQRTRPWAEALFRVDAEGIITCSTVEAAMGINVSRRDWYLKTLNAGRFTISDFFVTLMRQRPTIAAALPLAPGEGGAVLMANLDLGWFDGLAETIGRTPKTAVLLIDGAGRGVSRYPAMEGVTGKDLSGIDYVRSALSADEGHVEAKGLDGTDRLFGYRRLPGTDARLLVSLDRDTVLQPIDGAIARATLSFTLMIALMGGVIWLAGKRIFVTPLVEAGQALRKSEAFLRSVVDGSGDCIKVLDLRGNLEFISRNGQCLMEIDDADSMIGKPFARLFPAEMEAEILSKLDVARAGATARFDVAILTAKGNPLHVDVLITPIPGPDERPERLVAMARDITDLKRIEREVAESEACYRLLADNSTDMITHMDLAGRRLFVSPGSRDLLGYAPEELLGTSPYQMLHPDDVEGLRGVLGRLTSGAVERAVNVNRLRHRNGDWIWVEASLRLLRSEDGRPVGFVASIRSIEERRRSENALRDSEARYRMLAETTSDVIVKLDLSFSRDYVSPSCRAVFGYDPAELLGADASLLMHPDNVADVRERAERLLAGALEGDYDNVTYRMRHKDGRWIWVENRVGLVRDEATGHAQGLVCSIRDVSERQRQADELRAAKEAAELARTHADAASRAKTDFLATMSHEIRTPLNAIIGFTGLIMDKGDELPPVVRRQVELVQSAGAALLTVVDDILDFSKVEAGAIELEQRPFALGALIDNCLSIMRGTLRAGAVEVRANLDPGLPRGVVGDEARLRQILLNLLNNAGKFTHEGYIALSVRHEASSAKGERLRFSISDTGMGIPIEKQARLFERFSQADSSITRDFGGTGLGLAICKRLVELMDGEIGVFSEEKRGSTFWFTLTLPRGRLELSPVTADTDGGAHKRGRLLLVEDTEINQVLARAVIEARGHTVDVVGDGAAAVAAVQGSAYDLVLMDVQMPGMDGMSATRIIRSTAGPGPRLPVIAMTANVLPDQIRAFREAGMDDHVGKPFKRAELYAIIDRWLPERDTAVGGGFGEGMDEARATSTA